MNLEIDDAWPTWADEIAKLSDKENCKFCIPRNIYSEFKLNDIDSSYEKENEAIESGVWICKPIVEWLCTDTMVGIHVFFLNGEPVCASTQSGRKNDTYYYFFSEEAWNKVHSFLKSMIEDQYPWRSIISINDKMPKRI